MVDDTQPPGKTGFMGKDQDLARVRGVGLIKKIHRWPNFVFEQTGAGADGHLPVSAGKISWRSLPSHWRNDSASTQSKRLHF